MCRISSNERSLAKSVRSLGDTTLLVLESDAVAGDGGVGFIVQAAHGQAAQCPEYQVRVPVKGGGEGGQSLAGRPASSLGSRFSGRSSFVLVGAVSPGLFGRPLDFSFVLRSWLDGDGQAVSASRAPQTVHLHALVDDVEHLRQRGLGGGLVGDVLRDQVDVEAGPEGEQQTGPVHLELGGSDCGQ